MSAVAPDRTGIQNQLSLKLLFSKQLQVVTNKIHATQNIDEIMLELSGDLCKLFNSDRLTLYMVSDDRTAIVSKVKTGLNSFKDLKLPITDQSMAGYAAVSKQVVNVKDVYDEAELKAIHQNLKFLQEVDRRTGYRTKQMLVAPILDTVTDELIGVIQIINNRSGQSFGEIEEEGVAELTQTLAIAMRQRQRAATANKVGTKYDYLISDAVIKAQDLEAAQTTARETGVSVEDVLVRDYHLKPISIGNALAKFFSVRYEQFKPERIKPAELLKNLKRDFLESNQFVPLEEGPDGLLVMTLDPERVKAARMVNNIFPKTARFDFRVTTADEFKRTLDQMFGATADVGSVSDFFGAVADEEPVISGDEASAAEDNELVKFVNTMIVNAYNMGASDIHVEPYPGKEKTLIRVRRDGTLENFAEVPAAMRAPLIARLKIMCDLDISEKRKPQDGKIKFKKFGPLDIELRVATIPSAGGVEDVVMRILAAGEPIPLESLGLTLHNRERLQTTVSKPYGLFFVCGPTGSGKTTTLHSILKYLNTPETKIWTAEDPVEITQKGLRQVQVNRKAGLDFATVMKAFLRADPDIIMVGEMRDKETVSTGIEASLTGHLVFATLHTNSAPESIIRLLDMGMDPFNFADALLGVLAQRLAKRLCSGCKEAYVPDAAEIKSLLTEYSEELRNTPAWQQDGPGEAKKVYENWVKEYGKDGKLALYRTKGCEKCQKTGYKGRVGLHELLVGSDALKKQIQEHARVAEMFPVAVAEGMRTLKMDGIEKVLMGLTDIKQVRSVCIK